MSEPNKYLKQFPHFKQQLFMGRRLTGTLSVYFTAKYFTVCSVWNEEIDKICIRRIEF